MAGGSAKIVGDAPMYSVDVQLLSLSTLVDVHVDDVVKARSGKHEPLTATLPQPVMQYCGGASGFESCRLA